MKEETTDSNADRMKYSTDFKMRFLRECVTHKYLCKASFDKFLDQSFLFRVNQLSLKDLFITTNLKLKQNKNIQKCGAERPLF